MHVIHLWCPIDGGRPRGFKSSSIFWTSVGLMLARNGGRLTLGNENHPDGTDVYVDNVLLGTLRSIVLQDDPGGL